MQTVRSESEDAKVRLARIEGERQAEDARRTAEKRTADLRVAAENEFSMDALLLDIVQRLARALDAAGAETAHLKTIGLWEGFFGVANLEAIEIVGDPLASVARKCVPHSNHAIQRHWHRLSALTPPAPHFALAQHRAERTLER